MSLKLKTFQLLAVYLKKLVTVYKLIIFYPNFLLHFFSSKFAKI